MKICLFHVSDSHFQTKDDYVLKRIDSIAAAINGYLRDADALVIVYTGDIAYSGLKSEYGLALQFIEAVKKKVLQEKRIDIHVVVCPGNHDCDFAKDTPTRQLVIEAVKKSAEDIVSDDVIKTCTGVQEDFRNFALDAGCVPAIFDDGLVTQHELLIDQRRLLFSTVNVAWMSAKKESQGQLVFPVSRYSERMERAADLHVLAMHHPTNWFRQDTYQQFRSLVRLNCHLTLSGHEHSGGVFEIAHATEGDSAYIEAPALQPEDTKDPSGFTVVQVDLEKESAHFSQFTWMDSTYERIELAEPWSAYRKFPKKITTDLRVTEEFSQELEDPGGPFQHPQKRRLALSDVFVFPDMERVAGSQNTTKLVNANVLEIIGDLETKILIAGDDQAGKTALLKVLYRRYYDAGFFPLLISAKDLRQVSDDALKHAVETAVAEQYSKSAATKWEGLPRMKKVLLLDDFHRSAVSDRYRARIVRYAESHFGHIRIAAGAAQDIQELLSAETSDVLLPYEHLNIRPFGYKLRSALIKRWQSLADDASVGTEGLIGSLDRAEKIVNAVIGANVVPRTPFYLLTLLQSLTDPIGTDLRSSAYGHYYQYLIVRSLEQAKFSREQHDELFNYCAHLAWYFRNASSSEITRHELQEFNAIFSKTFVTIDFERRVQLLCEAKVLRERGGNYRFAYGFIYYYFLASYLAKHLSDDPSAQAVISNACDNLHIGENANTILFLTHHSNDPRVIDTVVGKLRSIMSEFVPLRLETDTAVLNDLVESVSKLVFRDSDPETNREKVNEARDQLSRDRDERASSQPQPAHSLGAQLEALFRVVEILGQILKNQYGTLQNDRKQELMNELFNGPLRALRSLVESVLKDGERLVSETTKWLEESKIPTDQARRTKLARTIVFDALSLIAFAFVQKASSSVSSKYLAETVAALTGAKSSVAFRLIGVSAALDSAAPMPMKEISALAKETEANIFPHRLLEYAVLMHLYMFKTSDREKQEITSALKIAMAKQRKIDQSTGRRKLIKK